jgi:hypothetical protein
LQASRQGKHSTHMHMASSARAKRCDTNQSLACTRVRNARGGQITAPAHKPHMPLGHRATYSRPPKLERTLTRKREREIWWREREQPAATRRAEANQNERRCCKVPILGPVVVPTHPPTHPPTHTPTSALTKRWQRRARLTKSPPQDEHAYRAHAHHEHGGQLAAAGRRKLLASARGRSRASENGQELAGGGKAACLRTNQP